jgi:hypothetical protein
MGNENHGNLEYWDPHDNQQRKEPFLGSLFHYSITPSLHYSTTP